MSTSSVRTKVDVYLCPSTVISLSSALTAQMKYTVVSC